MSAFGENELEARAWPWTKRTWPWDKRAWPWTKENFSKISSITFFLKGNYEFKIFFFENFPREPGHGQNANSLLKKTNVLGHGQNKCLSFL